MNKTPALDEPKILSSKPPVFDAIIFDIDNVLIDTKASYLEAIRWTVEIYLTYGKVPFFLPDKKAAQPSLLTPEDVDCFKLLGGFNDDWDCCYGILTYLFSLKVKRHTMAELKAAMNIKAFTKKISEHPLGVKGIVALCGPSSFVKIEKIGRIFQEVYLGKDLFQKVERIRPSYWKKRGLIHREKLIYRKAALEKLRAHNITFGIATGRPRFEALYALKEFGILHLFEALTTMDEVRRAEREQKCSLRKPHPFSLIETAKKIGLKKKFVYVGDLPDDIMAAHSAKDHHVNIQAVAYPALSREPGALKEIEKSKPHFIMRKPSDLFSIVLKGKL